MLKFAQSLPLKRTFANFVKNTSCCLCGKDYRPDELKYICPDHGDDGNLDILYDMAKVKVHLEKNGWGKEPGMWRYKCLMPIDMEAEIPPPIVGATPLYNFPKMAAEYGLGSFFLKDEGRNPTASLKDRASALLAAKAKDEKMGLITTASTGNAGAALAGMCASLDMPCVIFVPSSAPSAKICQLAVYGAGVVLVDGTYDDAFDMCAEATKKYGWYCRSTGFNPSTVEGKKTVIMEACEQMSGTPFDGNFDAPSHVIVSVGDGNIITGVHKGLKDLLELGLIETMPKLIGVQARGSNAIYQAFEKGLGATDYIEATETFTLADSISAGLPRDRNRGLRAVLETGGMMLEVEDEAIISAIPALARKTGVFPEPAASAAFAGFLKASQSGYFSESDSVMVLSTGNGLKDIISAQKSVSESPIVKPLDWSHLETILKDQYGLDV